MKFKIGDIVKITENPRILKEIGIENHRGGKEAKILNIDEEDDFLTYYVQIFCYPNAYKEKGLEVWISEEAIEPLIFSLEDYTTIYIKYHTPNLSPLERIEGKKSDWIDLRAAEDVTLKAGEIRRISLGISMQLSPNYEAHILPRSSTPEKFGIVMAHSQGIIDNSYCGDNDIWMFQALAIRDTTIHFNDRIAQFRIYQKQPDISFIPVCNLGNPNRGGFGSTGIK